MWMNCFIDINIYARLFYHTFKEQIDIFFSIENSFEESTVHKCVHTLSFYSCLMFESEAMSFQNYTSNQDRQLFLMITDFGVI